MICCTKCTRIFESLEWPTTNILYSNIQIFVILHSKIFASSIKICRLVDLQKIAAAPSSVMTTAKSDMPIISQALQVSISPCSTTSINSQGKMSPSSVVYMPMSPVAVVGPVQVIVLLKPGKSFRRIDLCSSSCSWVGLCCVLRPRNPC